MRHKVLPGNYGEDAERVFDRQEQFIREHFGEAAASDANYGWLQHMDPGAIYVITKVPEHGFLHSVSYGDGDECSLGMMKSGEGVDAEPGGSA